jgi:hypothetical protein
MKCKGCASATALKGENYCKACLDDMNDETVFDKQYEARLNLLADLHNEGKGR